MEIKNFLTFDLENWYDSEFITEKEGKDFVLEGLKKVVHLLDKYETKATFFVTGNVVEKYPAAVRDLARKGHEIASHSYEHKMLNKISKKEIIENITKSRKIIKKVTGEYPLGFRAPSWSITEDNFWVYEFLSMNGFRYSSSLFPIYMGSYGSWKYPTHSFYPTENSKVIEMPVRPFEILGLRIPFSGGVYLRIFPLVMIDFFMKRLNNKGERAMVYIHPWELCKDLPRVNTSFIGKIISYYGLKTTKKKLEYLLKNYRFDSIENISYNKSNKQNIIDKPRAISKSSRNTP